MEAMGREAQRLLGMFDHLRSLRAALKIEHYRLHRQSEMQGEQAVVRQETRCRHRSESQLDFDVEESPLAITILDLCGQVEPALPAAQRARGRLDGPELDRAEVQARGEIRAGQSDEIARERLNQILPELIMATCHS